TSELYDAGKSADCAPSPRTPATQRTRVETETGENPGFNLAQADSGLHAGGRPETIGARNCRAYPQRRPENRIAVWRARTADHRGRQIAGLPRTGTLYLGKRREHHREWNRRRTGLD